jgi:hypothetical protein
MGSMVALARMLLSTNLEDEKGPVDTHILIC